MKRATSSQASSKKSKAISIFDQLEKLNKSKYPKFIKDILTEAAFDTPAALKAINENSIGQIETFVSNRLHLLENTEYVSSRGLLKESPFKFKLGHEALILNFPKEVKSLSENSVKNKKPASQEELEKKLAEKITNYINKKKKKNTASHKSTKPYYGL